MPKMTEEAEQKKIEVKGLGIGGRTVRSLAMTGPE
jgi:hypothetical protein